MSKRKFSTPGEIFNPNNKRVKNGYQSEKTLNEEPENQTYVDGSIKYVSLQNFMTFQNFTYVPGPKINIVTGANGSGKSSFLQGIVLGLGKFCREMTRFCLSQNCNILLVLRGFMAP